MDLHKSAVARLSGFIHHNFLWILLGSYVLAAFVPGPGLAIKHVQFATIEFYGTNEISLSSLMLAVLLLNAGLGVQPRRLLGLLRQPLILLTGLLANFLVPLLFILVLSEPVLLGCDPVKLLSIVMSLALIGSMPVAGSSTAWTQNSNGDLALGLGLVVLSTCLSPITTPLVLHLVAWFSSGVYAEGMQNLAAGGASFFLMVFVLLPALVGILLRGLLGEQRLTRARPVIKLVNSLNLLVLIYANAAVALPEAVADPDWELLIFMLLIVTALCLTGFASGWLIARWLRADEGQRIALMFGLGMNNNGTALVLAASTLSHLPAVLLPIILYNLVQHIVAAGVNCLLSRGSTDEAIAARTVQPHCDLARPEPQAVGSLANIR